MKKFWASLVVAVATLLSGAVALPVAAEIGDICKDAGKYSQDIIEAAGCKLDENANAIPVVISLIEVALSIVGILAVIIIVYGGVTYVISTGDAVKVQRAKNTILYGVIGMVVALLAYTIVYFVSASIWG